MDTFLPDYSAYLNVAAAVIRDKRGWVLIARRPEHLHQGGLWEFPGGKLEAGEGVEAALCRELEEELGLIVHAMRPLIRVPHCYPDIKVLLDVWQVTRFSGPAYGREGQEVRWVAPEALHEYAFPAANTPVVTAARLPGRYLITPEPGPRAQWNVFVERFSASLERGIRLAQFRAKGLTGDEYRELAGRLLECAERASAALLLNGPLELLQAIPAAGLHLPSKTLLGLESRPLPPGRWLAASCHNRVELEHAMRIGVDFVVLSPVRPTRSHPGTTAMGWHNFHVLTEMSTLPAYALGGMQLEDLELAWRHGGQGIAAIGSLWCGDRD